MHFILLILRSDVFLFHSWHQSACQQLFWHWEKLNFLNKLISETFCLLGFAKFEIKQWFSAYQDKVCAWFSLARLPTEVARKLFLYHFLKKKRLYLSFSGFSNLFNASAIVHILKTFRHFKTAERKTLQWGRQSCVCPLIDHRREPIKMRE